MDRKVLRIILDSKLQNNEPLLIASILSFVKCKNCSVVDICLSNRLCKDCSHNQLLRVCDSCDEVVSEGESNCCDNCLTSCSCFDCDKVLYCCSCHTHWCQECQPVFMTIKSMGGYEQFCGNCLKSIW